MPHAERDLTGRSWFAVVLLFGIALRAKQLLEGAPLWLDELALVHGVLAGPFGGLFDGPSDFAQVAPPGFLALEWLLFHAFPSSALALRLPAFVLGCGAIWFTWTAAREIVGERHAWVAAGLVALAGPLVFMAGQVKPYAADAFFAALIISVVLRHDRHHTRRSFLALLLTGAAAPLFSIGSVFVLAGAGAFHATSVPWRSIEWRPMLVLGAVFATSTLVSIVLTGRLLSPSTDALMQTYWTDAFPPLVGVDFIWPFRQLLDLSWTLMGLRAVRVVGIVFVVAAVIAWRRRPALMLLLLAPIVAAIVAAMLREYPFGTRLLHWMAPVLALLLTIAVSRAGLALAGGPQFVTTIPGLIVLAAPTLTIATNPPPYLRDDIRPIIAALSSDMRPGDHLYVYWGAWHSWSRYGKQVAASGDVYLGGCPIDYPRGYLRELDRFRGQPRLWVLFGRMQYEEEHRLILDYLDAIGSRTGSVIVEVPRSGPTARSDLHRYDLSDSSRLGMASAETFPIPAGLERTATGCGVIDAMLRRGDGTRVVPLFP